MLDIGPWLGFLAPAGPPDDILARLHDAIDATLREPAIVDQMKNMFMIIDHMDQRSYQSFNTGEFDRWGQYIRTVKVTVDQ